MDASRRFELAPCPPAQVAELRRALAISGPLAQVLVRRGLGEPAAATAFLQASEEHSPAAFAGIEPLLAKLLRHVSGGTRITVHGDYDVDGICSTAVLVRVLRALGADVDWYLPDRAADGYGLNPLTVRRLAARGTRLLVTADCAITAVAEVALAQSLGVEVIVTDHHSPRADGTLPAAPILHPTVCGYPCAELCATAVAYKLAQALWEAAGARRHGSGSPDTVAYEPEEDLDLVALATIADVVALRGENRTLVKRGLRALAGTAKPGLRALMAVAHVAAGAGGICGSIGERAVAFGLAPRLNAAGRLYRADAGLELILTLDPERAQQIAGELDRANRERRATELRILGEAEQHVAQLGQRAGYVLAGEDWHAGVIGIVASRLAERHHRPFVLVALDGEAGRGSGRSIERFDLLGALHACGGHLLRYGGHRAAAGLEVSRERLMDFGEAFAAHAAQALGEELDVRGERADAVVEGDELGIELAEELQRLAPFGAGNPTVALLVRAGTFADRQPMGEGRHVRFTLRCGQSSARAVAFGGGTSLPVSDGEPADATFALEVNEWRGVSEPRLVLRHAQPAARTEEIEPAPTAELASAAGEQPAAGMLAQEDARLAQGELVLF